MGDIAHDNAPDACILVDFMGNGVMLVIVLIKQMVKFWMNIGKDYTEKRSWCSLLFLLTRRSERILKNEDAELQEVALFL